MSPTETTWKSKHFSTTKIAMIWRKKMLGAFCLFCDSYFMLVHSVIDANWLYSLVFFLQHLLRNLCKWQFFCFCLSIVWQMQSRVKFKGKSIKSNYLIVNEHLMDRFVLLDFLVFLPHWISKSNESLIDWMVWTSGI